MTTETFLDYLAQTASTGQKTELNVNEKLAAYHDLTTVELHAILNLLIQADILTHVAPKDQYSYVVPPYAPIPTAEELPQIEEEIANRQPEIKELPPNNIQVFPKRIPPEISLTL